MKNEMIDGRVQLNEFDASCYLEPGFLKVVTSRQVMKVEFRCVVTGERSAR